MSDPKSNPTRQQKNHKTRLSPDGQSPNRPQPETGDHLRPLKVDPGGGWGATQPKRRKKAKTYKIKSVTREAVLPGTRRTAKLPEPGAVITKEQSRLGKAATLTTSSHTYHNQQDLDPNGYYDHAASIR